ncbi:MAG: hypothetical protein PVH77_04780 [Phycisphaerales bacterium]|jgi:hypothetical protein
MMRKIFLLVLCLSITPVAVAGVTGINYEAQTNITVTNPVYSDPNSSGLPSIQPVSSKSFVEIYNTNIFVGGASQGIADFLSIQAANTALYIASNGSSSSTISLDSSAIAEFEVSMATPWTLDIGFTGQNFPISSIPATTDMLMLVSIYDSAMNPYSEFKHTYDASLFAIDENDGGTFDPGTYFLTLEISINNIFTLLETPSSGSSYTLGGITAEITSAIIPAPGAILLGSIGIGLVGWLRRRRTI